MRQTTITVTAKCGYTGNPDVVCLQLMHGIPDRLMRAYWRVCERGEIVYVNVKFRALSERGWCDVERYGILAPALSDEALDEGLITFFPVRTEMG